MKNNLLKLTHLIENYYAFLQEYKEKNSTFQKEYFEFVKKKKSEPATPSCPCGVEYPRMFDKYQAMLYLSMSKSTYYRKVKNGELVPRKLGNTDFYYEEDLEKEYQESLRRGRI